MEIEHLRVGGKESHMCEYCKKAVNLETGKEDYLQSEVEGTDIWIHIKCFERAEMLSKLEWDRDY